MLMRRAVGALGPLMLALACSSPPPPAAPESAGPEALEDEPAASKSEGEEAIAAGDFERARAIYTDLTRAEPNNARAHFYLGVALQNLGQADAAIASYRKAVDLSPKLLEAHVNLTAAMLDAGDAAGALPVIDRALSQHPGDAGLTYNRALALSALGKHAEAVPAYRAALAAEPSNVEIKYGYAEALVLAGSNDAAEKELAGLAQSDSLDVLASTARLYGRLQNFDACIKALDKAIGLKKSSELYVSRGLCQHGKKDDAAAYEDFQRAVQTDGSYAPGHYYVGMHLKVKGKKAEARAALTKARDLGGDEGVGKAAQRALESL